MPYPPKALVEEAVLALEGTHPILVVVLPALLRKARQLGVDAHGGIEYGAGDELRLLDEFFRLPGAPDPDRPFRAVWADKPPQWQGPDYARGTSLQRMRTDLYKAGVVFEQRKRRPGSPQRGDIWVLRARAGAEMVRAKGVAPIRLVDLALWYGRDRQLDSLDELVATFVETFGLNSGDLIGTVYSRDLPAAYRQVPLAPEPMSQTDYADKIAVDGLPEAVKVATSFDELVEAIEAQLHKDRFVCSPGLVRRVLSAWLRGDIVVLVGQPGTGKSLFCRLVGEALVRELGMAPPIYVPVRPDFDDTELIGYERLDGTPYLREFAEQLLTTRTAVLEARLIVLDEFNLATVENYLTPILVAAQDAERRLRLPGGEPAELPVDALFIATCNSYRDDPDTRTRLSYPAKRRCTIITMPNTLYEQVREHGLDVVAELAAQLIETEWVAIERRRTLGRASSLDLMRANRLSTIPADVDLSPVVRNRLGQIAGAILSTPEGQSYFTLGLLRDVALAIAYSAREEDAEVAALRDAVADKLAHQLRGPHERADELLAALEGVPDLGELISLFARMKAGPPDELLPLV